LTKGEKNNCFKFKDNEINLSEKQDGTSNKTFKDISSLTARALFRVGFGAMHVPQHGFQVG